MGEEGREGRRGRSRVEGSRDGKLEGDGGGAEGGAEDEEAAMSTTETEREKGSEGGARRASDMAGRQEARTCSGIGGSGSDGLATSPAKKVERGGAAANMTMTRKTQKMQASTEHALYTFTYVHLPYVHLPHAPHHSASASLPIPLHSSATPDTSTHSSIAVVAPSTTSTAMAAVSP